ncbi:MAG: alpha-glucoside transport system permease protein [Frankiaceae bacterium]|nr:alpha-glucoside transport system permease protein [Frankiaceae bacterium]
MNFADQVPKLGTLLIGIAIFFAVVALVLLLVDRAPKRNRERWQIGFLLAPAVLLLGVGLIYPALRTTYLSFTNNDGTKFVGLDNYKWMFTTPDIRIVLRNTALWVILGPLVATSVGLVYAVLVDKTKFEKLAKSLIFLPMAISFVGAGIIWKFVYAGRVGKSEIGLLNQLVLALGGTPWAWTVRAPWNTLFLIVVMVWIQAGFATVVLSAAIKGIPADTVEAARIDGANSWQMFWQITVPSIRPALVVVVVTISIATLKVFDIVRAMTGGNFDTSVVANEMYNQSFRYNEYGHGAALALLLFLLVLPIVFYQIRAIRQRREI